MTDLDPHSAEIEEARHAEFRSEEILYPRFMDVGGDRLETLNPRPWRYLN